MHEVLIVGASAAGLSAALLLGRMHRDVVVIDGGRPRNAPASGMHNVLTRDGTSPAEYLRLAHRELRAYPGVAVERASVVAVGRTADGFEADLTDGRMLAARRILLATGLTDQLPDIPGIRALWGRSVLHCPYCHGWEVNGRPVAVQGAGPARVRLALQLRRFTEDVVLCADGEPVDADDLARLRAAGVAVRTEPVSALDHEDGRLQAVEFVGGPSLRREVLFANGATGQRSGLAAQVGCALLPDGGVEIDEFGRTSVAGVYAAGDMAHRNTLPMPLASVSAAGASGQVAAAAIDQDLLSGEFGLPNPLAAATVH